MKKRGVCIGGYAGCGNYGDDAILEAMIARLTERGVPRDSVTALTGRPRRDRRRFGVRCEDRMNPAAVFRALRQAELFVCGGGSLLQNRTGNRSLGYYLALLRLAKRLGCRVAYFGGVGPVGGERARRRTAETLNQCEQILLRDEDSANLLQKIGVSGVPVRVGADPAFLLPPPPPMRVAFLQRALLGNDPRPYFCVCMRGDSRGSLQTNPLQSADARSALRAAVSRVAALGYFPVFVVADRKKDGFCLHGTQIFPEKAVFYPRDVSELTAVLSAARFTVSCRLHPLILSVAASVPCLGIAENVPDGDSGDNPDGGRSVGRSNGRADPDPAADPKIASFCRAAGVPLLPPDASADDLFAAAVSLSSRPRPDPAPFRKKAEKDLAILCEMLYNEREP